MQNLNRNDDINVMLARFHFKELNEIKTQEVKSMLQSNATVRKHLQEIADICELSGFKTAEEYLDAEKNDLDQVYKKLKLNHDFVSEEAVNPQPQSWDYSESIKQQPGFLFPMRTPYERELIANFFSFHLPDRQKKIREIFSHYLQYFYYQAIWKLDNTSLGLGAIANTYYAFESQLMNVNFYVEDIIIFLRKTFRTKLLSSFKTEISELDLPHRQSEEKSLVMYYFNLSPGFSESPVGQQIQDFAQQFALHTESYMVTYTMQELVEEQFKSIGSIYKEIACELLEFGGPKFKAPFVTLYLHKVLGKSDEAISDCLKAETPHLVKMLRYTAQIGLDNWRNQILENIWDSKEEISYDTPQLGISFTDLMDIIYNQLDSERNVRIKQFLSPYSDSHIEEKNDMIETIEGLLKIKQREQFKSKLEHIKYTNSVCSSIASALFIDRVRQGKTSQVTSS